MSYVGRQIVRGDCQEEYVRGISTAFEAMVTTTIQLQLDWLYGTAH